MHAFPHLSVVAGQVSAGLSFVDSLGTADAVFFAVGGIAIDVQIHSLVSRFFLLLGLFMAI